MADEARAEALTDYMHKPTRAHLVRFYEVEGGGEYAEFKVPGEPVCVWPKEMFIQNYAPASPLGPSREWALGFAYGLRAGCPGPEPFWEHGEEFAAGFDAARAVKDDLSDIGPPRLATARKVVEILRRVACTSKGTGTLRIEDRKHGWAAEIEVSDVLEAASECNSPI